jgi:hypothetical protein
MVQFGEYEEGPLYSPNLKVNEAGLSPEGCGISLIDAAGIFFAFIQKVIDTCWSLRTTYHYLNISQWNYCIDFDGNT